MGEKSTIQWCTHTFNPWIGCTKVSPGCTNCYAEMSPASKFGGIEWGIGKERRRTVASNWAKPVHWNRKARDYPDQCRKCGARLCMKAQEQLGTLRCPSQRDDNGKLDPSRPVCNGEVDRNVRALVFCASLSDWLDDEVPTEWRAELLALVCRTPHLTWQLLTKRPENFGRLLDDAIDDLALHNDPLDDKQNVNDVLRMLKAWRDGTPPANVWIGTTVEDQKRADDRIPALLAIPARVRFLSVEPQIEAVNLAEWLAADNHGFVGKSGGGLQYFEGAVDWVIVGGESGSKARPFSVEWMRAIVEQCAEAGVPVFCKQLGAKPFTVDVDYEEAGGRMVPRDVPRALHLTDSHGGDINEFPQDLRVRQFPSEGK